MTKIKRLTIHGFKSFAHKTDVIFDDKYNVILGPNGSGKSNVGDAICFVLGRLSAKSMRAEKASNLIFNGGKKKKPASTAYVEIVFTNDDGLFPGENKEIVINRTITKKGSSIYRINGDKRTRTETLELLSLAKINPEGYNIILQGDITRFVDMSPLERRRIIEQISDISRYEEKKHKALLELNKVEDKLNNAVIILKERKAHLRELKKDRDQALKFKGLKDKIDSNKATYYHLQITEKNKDKEKYDSEISKLQEKIDTSETKINELKEQVNERKKKVEDINHEIERKGEKEQLQVHKAIEDLRVSLAQDKARVSTLKDEINKIQLRKDQLENDLKELEDKTSSYDDKNKTLAKNIESKRRELNEVEESIAKFKKKHKIDSSGELDKDIEDKDKLIEQKQEDVQKIRQKQQELLREKDRIEFQLESIDERIKKVKEVKQQNKEQIKELQQKKNNFKNATLKLNKCLDLDSSYASQLSNARRNLVDLQEKQAKLNAKFMSIQASLSSNKAVASIIANKNKFKGVYGTISELGQVNKEYALPLETAAGARMQNIVVKDDQVASECIKYLKNNKLGSASFIPLNKIRYIDISPENKRLLNVNGVHDFALNLISFKSEFKKAFSYVFGNTLVVEDIDTARKVGIGKIKMTTMDGNTAESSGVMKGGFRAARKSGGFKEKDSMEKLERIDHEVSELQAVISNVSVKREGNEREISSLRNLKSEMEADIIKLEKMLHLESGDLDASSTLKKELEAKLDEVDDNIVAVQREITKINRDLAELKSKKQMLRTQINELRNPRLLAQLSAFEESRQKSREDILRMESDLKNTSVQVDQMIAPEREKIKEILKQHTKEEEKFSVEIKELSIKVDDNEKVLKQKEVESKEFYSKYKELFNQREKLSADINNIENKVENIREKSRNGEREINLISLKNAEVKAKLAALNDEFSKFEGKEVEILENKTLPELKLEINRFEVMLAQMSAVNMKALEIYEQVETEYNRLIEKKDSLEGEKVDVLTLMNEIETKKKEHFMKTFDRVNEHFKEIFIDLFRKGNAYLELENPENPFEGGMNVKVKLTGNRFTDIKSLSGGEKSMTALSFIFAIQEYDPASFYILDEIDAALDKHNSDTLANLIKNYSDRAQYVIISHKDSLITEADSLYGVSMSPDLISKITSLKI